MFPGSLNSAGVSGSKFTVTRRTRNLPISSSDAGTLINITSGTFTQTLAAANTLGDGWWCYIRNSGTGDVTLDPNGSETIDDLTSFVMYPGETRLVQCTGSVFNSVVLKGFYKTFTATGTFTTPPGYALLSGLLWGGGGGGGFKSTNTATGYPGNGGGGACNQFVLGASSFGASQTVTIGSGGVGGTNDSTNGTVGGTSSIGTVLYAYGGGGGVSGSGSATENGGGGGILSAGNTSSIGGNPSATIEINGTAFTASYGWGGGSGKTNDILPTHGGGGGGGGMSIFGGGGGGGSAGGTSIFGGNGGRHGSNAAGTDGTAPAGGGGGGTNGASSGAGARGELRIWGVM